MPGRLPHRRRGSRSGDRDGRQAPEPCPGPAGHLVSLLAPRTGSRALALVRLRRSGWCARVGLVRPPARILLGRPGTRHLDTAGARPLACPSVTGRCLPLVRKPSRRPVQGSRRSTNRQTHPRSLPGRWRPRGSFSRGGPRSSNPPHDQQITAAARRQSPWPQRQAVPPVVRPLTSKSAGPFWRWRSVSDFFRASRMNDIGHPP